MKWFLGILNATLIFKGWLSSWECIILLILVWTDNSFLLFIFSLLIALVSAIWFYVLACLYWIRFTINMQLKNIQLSGKINSYSLSCLHLFCSKHRRFHEVLAWIHPSQLKWIITTKHISKLKFKNFMHFHWAPIPVNKMVLMVLIVFFPESGINSWVT